MKRRISTEERKLWRTAMRDAVPLREGEDFAALVADDGPPVIPIKARQPHRPLFKEQTPPPKKTTLSQDVDARTLTRFKRGQMPIDGTLDLHGHRMHEARDALLGFIRQQHGRGARCLPSCWGLRWGHRLRAAARRECPGPGRSTRTGRAAARTLR